MSLLPELSKQYAELYDFAKKVIYGTLENIEMTLPEDEDDKKRMLEDMTAKIAKRLLDNKPKIKKVKKNRKKSTEKKALSGYLYFCGQERSAVVEKYPHYKPADVLKELGRKWSKLDEEEKGLYKEQSKEDFAEKQKTAGDSTEEE